MMRVKVDTSRLKKLAANVSKIMPEARLDIGDVLVTAGKFLQEEVARLTPHDTGALLGEMQRSPIVETDKKGLALEVGFRPKYATKMERGSGPKALTGRVPGVISAGKYIEPEWPMVDRALKTWVRRHYTKIVAKDQRVKKTQRTGPRGGAQGKEAQINRIAYFIWRKHYNEGFDVEELIRRTKKGRMLERGGAKASARMRTAFDQIIPRLWKRLKEKQGGVA